MTHDEYIGLWKALKKKMKAGLITEDEYAALGGKLDKAYQDKKTAQEIEKEIGCDPGTLATDDAIIKLGKEFRKIYGQAAQEMQAKLGDFLKTHTAELDELSQKAADGTITQEEAKRLEILTLQKAILGQKVDQLTGVMTNANKKAMAAVNGEMLGVFAENAAWQSYQLTQDAKMDLMFSIYDERTAENLIRNNPELLPPRKGVNGQKDQAWNRKMLAGTVAQAVIQGDSIPKLARRIAADLSEKNSRAMMRYARTAMTGAQNAGRIEMLHQAEGMGIMVKKRWLATLDNRTRDSHQHMDGVSIGVDEEFKTPLGSKMQYPGDVKGKVGDIWNCRCTLVYDYDGFPNDPAADVRRDNEDSQVIANMTYDEWKAGKIKGGSGVNYTSEEREGVDAYVSSSYSGINTALRNGTVEDYPDVKRIVDAIDQAMEKSELAEDTICSRGTDFYELSGLWGHRPDWYEEEDHLNSIIGKDAVVKSYTSTTKGETPLQQYASKGVEIVYDVDAGVHAIDIEKISGRNAATVEKELLLDRNIVIRPTKIEYTTDEDGFVEGKVRIYVKVFRNDEDGKQKQELNGTQNNLDRVGQKKNIESEEEKLHAIKQIKNINDEEAKRIAKALYGYHGDPESCWCDGRDSAIRSGATKNDAEDARLLQKLVDNSPKFEGTIFRGMGVNKEMLDALQVGTKFSEEKYALSSWSSREDVARRYASRSANENGNNRVVFEIENHTHGAPIAHISLYETEQEVLVNNKNVQYEITERKQVDVKDRTFFWIKLAEVGK